MRTNTTNSVAGTGGFISVTASCLAGERLTGCGVFMGSACAGGSLANTCQIIESNPNSGGTSCAAQAYVGSSIPQTVLVTSAICRF